MAKNRACSVSGESVMKNARSCSRSATRTGRMRSVRPLRRRTSASRWTGYATSCSAMVMFFSGDDKRTSGQFGEEARELFVGEVVPAAARVVLFLLHVARDRQFVHDLPRELPAVGEVFELLARHARASLVEPGVAAAQASIAVAMKSLAEDAALRCDLADGVVIVSEFDQLGAKKSDHFGPRNGFLFRQY